MSGPGQQLRGSGAGSIFGLWHTEGALPDGRRDQCQRDAARGDDAEDHAVALAKCEYTAHTLARHRVYLFEKDVIEPVRGQDSDQPGDVELALLFLAAHQQVHRMVDGFAVCGAV